MTEDELKHKKEKAMRCKVIALHRLGYHPVNTNISTFNHKNKERLLEMVKQLFEEEEEQKIVNEFNDIVSNIVLEETADFSTYPVYSREPIQSE